jgi:hypothetical protein
VNIGARKPSEPELISAFQAAMILGVTRSNLYTVSGLPEPYQKRGTGPGQVHSGNLWRRREIEQFAFDRAERRAIADAAHLDAVEEAMAP